MEDNADSRLDRLFAAARVDRPDTASLELHFETRLMSRIAERKAGKLPWFLLEWRMMPLFAIIALLSAACSIAFNPVRSTDIFAAITVGQEDRVAASYFAGEQP